MNVTDLAKICCFAQNHSHDWDWSLAAHDKRYAFEHVSFVISCFIAQQTMHGSEGCEWEIVIDELTGPVKDLEEWKSIVGSKVLLFGGMK